MLCKLPEPIKLPKPFEIPHLFEYPFPTDIFPPTYEPFVDNIFNPTTYVTIRDNQFPSGEVLFVYEKLKDKHSLSQTALETDEKFCACWSQMLNIYVVQQGISLALQNIFNIPITNYMHSYFMIVFVILRIPTP